MYIGYWTLNKYYYYILAEKNKKRKLYTGDTTCACGKAEEITAHMLQCPQLAHPCFLDNNNDNNNNNNNKILFIELSSSNLLSSAP